MQYFGTNFSLTLGAMRLRFAFMLEDADETTTAAPVASSANTAAQRANYDRVHSN